MLCMNNYRRSLKSVMIFLSIFTTLSLNALDVMADIIQPAQALKGSPYVYGKEGPGSFDCSGLVYYLYKPFLATIPRSSRDYTRFGSSVAMDNLKPGDLLLFATTGTPGRVSHVAIYIGQHSVIHAVSNGPQTGVIVSSIDSGYWKRKLHSARRVFDFTTPAEAVVEYERGRYTGPLKNGEPSGTGRMEMNNGDLYTGEFAEGLFHGRGTYIWKNGDSYTGEFRRGEIVEKSEIPAEEETYMKKQDNPWDNWDGEVYGDYREWRSREESAFEAFKERDKAGTQNR